MWSRRRIAIVAVAFLAVAGTAVAIVVSGANEPGQQPGPLVVQPGAPGESGRTLSPDELASLNPPPHNAADVEFFDRMMAHHGQALEMTALVTARTTHADLRLLAERIEVSQQDEIGFMQTWLTRRGLPVPEVHTDHSAHVGMPGMLTNEQLDQLEQASGAAFDRLFLEFMIYHHQGALTMANELYERGGGLEPESDRFARDVIADQSIEIVRMQEMLAALPA